MARLTQTLRADGGLFEWLPQENIFYPESAVQLRTIVRLDAGARFIGWEIGCLGLPARQASLGEGSVRQSFELWHETAPLLLERVNIERACLNSRWVHDEATTLGWLQGPSLHGIGTLDLPLLLRLHRTWSAADMPAVRALECAVDRGARDFGAARAGTASGPGSGSGAGRTRHS